MCGRRVDALSVVLALILIPGRAAAAQETVNYASVSGRVTDQTGAVLAGAGVTARQLETNVQAATTTDRDGRFRFAYLRVGPYELTVDAKGLAPATRRLTLTVGAAFDLPITLTVARFETDVVVTTDSTVLEAARSQIAGTVSQKEVAALPMNGRSFLDLALLIPGVSPTNVGGGTQLFPETSACPASDRRVRVVALRRPEDARPCQRRAFLRPGPAASAGQRAAPGRQHHGSLTACRMRFRIRRALRSSGSSARPRR